MNNKFKDFDQIKASNNLKKRIKRAIEYNVEPKKIRVIKNKPKKIIPFAASFVLLVIAFNVFTNQLNQPMNNSQITDDNQNTNNNSQVIDNDKTLSNTSEKENDNYNIVVDKDESNQDDDCKTLSSQSQNLTYNEAKQDSSFGEYIPQSIPNNYVFENATKNEDNLTIVYTSNYNYIWLDFSKITEDDKKRIVDINETETYDINLYPIPRAETVPDYLRDTVDNPIFKIDDLTEDVLKRRYFQPNEAGDPGGRMRFTLMYDDTLISFSIKGLDVTEVMAIINSVNY